VQPAKVCLQVPLWPLPGLRVLGIVQVPFGLAQVTPLEIAQVGVGAKSAFWSNLEKPTCGTQEAAPLVLMA
jgi:hypothetical protein